MYGVVETSTLKTDSRIRKTLFHKNSAMNPVLVGGVIGAIFQIVLFVGIIAFCVFLCCWCHKRCRKRRNRTQLSVVNASTVVHVPQPLPPAGYQPSYPGYQPGYFQPAYTTMPMPMPPGAPPSYLEAMDPANAPLAAAPGPLMYPFPNPPQPMQPYSDESAQKPYNPAYCPNV